MRGMGGSGRVEAPHDNRRDLHNLRQLAGYLKPYRARVWMALACLLLGKFAIVAVPLLLREIINTLEAATRSGPSAEVAASSAALLALGLVAAYGALRISSSMLNELRDGLFARVRFHAMHLLSTRVLTHLHELTLAYHLERRTGSISRDLSRGTASLSTIVNLLVFNIVPTLLEFALVAGILLFQFDWRYSLVVTVTVLIYVVFTARYSTWRMQLRHEMNHHDSQANGRAVDSLLNYETVKYFNNESLELNAYDAHLEKWEDAAVKSHVTMGILNFGQATIVTVGVTLLMSFAARDVLAGTITLGDIVMINALMLQLFVPLNALGFVYRGLQYALADMDLVIRLLERDPDIVDAAAAVPLKVDSPAIEFDQVRFAYLPERPILKGISFRIEAGQKVAVVGPSGSGKSTLARLLFRFYEVDEGAIRIAGQDIRDVTQASLREALGVVPQDTVMFNESLHYNIAYARPGADQQEIDRVVNQAQLSRFVEQLPDGLDTVVGERGLKLSGGEKQRVAIARVMLKDPPIIVFDEATSSLDTQTEQDILTSLEAAAESRTSLVIAHRLSTVVDADHIVVLENGELREQGSHEQLMGFNGLYARLWSLQQAEEQDSTNVQTDPAIGQQPDSTRPVDQ